MIFVYIVFSQIKTGLLSSSAFEVYLDGKLIFSKLQTGEIPSPENINRALKEHDIITISQSTEDSDDDYDDLDLLKGVLRR